MESRTLLNYDRIEETRGHINGLEDHLSELLVWLYLVDCTFEDGVMAFDENSKRSWSTLVA